MKDWLRDQTGRLLARVEEQLEKAAGQPGAEEVHDLRTSIRRLRECLRVFEDFYPSKRVRPVAKALKSLMHLAAEIRNRDITIELLQSSGIPAVRLRRSLEEQREDFRKRLVSELQADSDHKHKAEWNRALSSLQDPGKSSEWKPKQDVQQNAARVLPKIRKDYWKSGRKLVGKHQDFETLHRFRLKTKRYRYTLELFREIDIQPAVETELERLKPVQDLLGSINDCATALELIGGTSGRHPRFAQYLHERAARKIAKLGTVLDRS